jgi:hypothetical protein
MELGQRLYADEPLAALRLAAEAFARVPRTDNVLSERALASLRDMVAAGRLAKIAVSGEKPIAVGDSDFIVINEAGGSTLRRSFDGAVVARLPLKVESVASDEMKPTAERVPYFLVRYGYQRQELRRKRDGSVVTEFSVESVTRVASSLALIKYFGGATELRRDDHDTVRVPLTAEANVTPIEGAPCFVVSYPSAPMELRSSASGKTMFTLPKFSSLQTSADRRIFAIDYTEGSQKYEVGRRSSNGSRVALFDAHCHRMPLAEVPAAVSFDAHSSRYVVAYHQSNGEIRSTSSAEVTPLRAPVDAAAFIGQQLFVSYQTLVTEMQDPEGRVLLTWPDFLVAAGVPGTEHAIVMLRDNRHEIVDLRSGDRKPIDLTGSIDTQQTPGDAGPLQYFVRWQYNAAHAPVYEIRSAATGETVLKSEEVSSSPSTPWVVAVDGEHPLLFDLRNGRKVRMSNAGLRRLPLYVGSSVIPNYPSISLQAWSGLAFFLVRSVPSEIRRATDGSLIVTLDGECRGRGFSPDGTLLAVVCERVEREYASDDGTPTRLMRADGALYSTRTARKVAAFGSAVSEIEFTAHGMLGYIGNTAEVHHLRGGPSFTGRSLQISSSREWLAVQHGTTRSELWHDDGQTATQHAIGRLPDGAILIAADTTGRRVVVWEPNGAILLIAGDVLASLARNPPATPDAVLQFACTLINSFQGDRVALDHVAFGEQLHACGGS